MQQNQYHFTSVNGMIGDGERASKREREIDKKRKREKEKREKEKKKKSEIQMNDTNTKKPPIEPLSCGKYHVSTLLNLNVVNALQYNETNRINEW